MTFLYAIRCTTEPFQLLDECTEQDLLRHHGETYSIIDISEQNSQLYEYTLILGQSINQRDNITNTIYFLGNYGQDVAIINEVAICIIKGCVPNENTDANITRRAWAAETFAGSGSL